MAHLKDILAYILKVYPFKRDLSNARVTKLIYLADWKHVLEEGSPVSGIDWYFDNYGPFAWDVRETAEEYPRLFEVRKTKNYFGGRKSEFRLRSVDYAPSLSASEQSAIDHVVQVTKDLTWEGFIRLVYSTYPVVNSVRYSRLDLPNFARAYQFPAAVSGGSVASQT